MTDLEQFTEGLPGLDARADLTDVERRYIGASRAENTKLAYASDWREFTAWCAMTGRDPIPTSASTVSAYLAGLADAGAKATTMSRRRSAIAFVHRLHGFDNPCDEITAAAVWDGIRREHAERPDQARPLMPPELWDVVAACPSTKRWKTRGRTDEPDLAGARDRALLLVGFVGALRRSELNQLNFEDIREHPNGLVLELPRSKTNQRGDHDELVALPRASVPAHCPVNALTTWLELAGITEGQVFRAVSKGNRVLERRLTVGAINDLVQAAVVRSGIIPAPKSGSTSEIERFGGYSAHSLRAGFVTYAHSRGASDRAVAHQTRHRSLASVGTYIRLETVWADNAATQIGL